MIIPFRMNIAHILAYFKKYYQRRSSIPVKRDSIMLINRILYKR